MKPTIESIQNIELNWATESSLDCVDLFSSYLDFKLEIRIYLPDEDTPKDEIAYHWEIDIRKAKEWVIYDQYHYTTFGESELNALKQKALKTLKEQLFLSQTR